MWHVTTNDEFHVVHNYRSVSKDEKKYFKIIEVSTELPKYECPPPPLRSKVRNLWSHGLNKVDFILSTGSFQCQSKMTVKMLVTVW